MTSIWIAALLAAAAIGATYLFCVRPAPRGRGQCGKTAAHNAGPHADAEIEAGRQLADVTQEPRDLRTTPQRPPAASGREFERR